MWRYDSIQFRGFNPTILMWTQHRINTEKLYFFTRETNNMDTDEEDNIAIYITSVNMFNVFTNFQMDFIFSLRSYDKEKKI